MPDRNLEIQWIGEHGKEYAGQWVALDRNRLLSHGTSSREVIAAARQLGVEAPFITHLETNIWRVAPIDISREKQ